MNIKDLASQMEAKQAEITQYIARKLPVKAGAMAKSFFQENFRKGGFQNGGIDKWPETRRQRTGRGADSQRGPLLSSRKVLYNSIRYAPGSGRVSIYTTCPYAGIHNQGGITHPKVTPKMRRFAWAKFYEAGGSKKGQESEEATMWKRMALTKKERLNITIPKRQFMGKSKDLENRLQTMITNDLNTILKS